MTTYRGLLLCGAAGISLILGSWFILHPRPTDYVAAANQFLAAGKPQTALIELNNAVLKNPKNGQAQLMLAKLSVQLGEPISAQRAARAAIAVGYQSNEALTELLFTYLVQRHDIELLHEFPDEAEPGERAARIEIGRGEADLALQQTSDAQAAFASAVTHDPQLNLAYFAEEDLALSQGDLAAARHDLELGRNLDKTAPEGLLREAQLLIIERRPSDALKILMPLTDKFPSDIVDRLTLIQAFMSNSQIKDAQREDQKLLTEAPNTIQAIDDEAALDVATRQWSEAQAALERISPLVSLLANGEYLQALVASHFGLYAEAEQAVAHYTAQHPGDSQGLQLAAEVALQAGAEQQARSDIMSLQDQRLVFPELLVMRGAERQANQDYAAAQADYTRAILIDPRNEKARISLGQVALLRNDAWDAVTSLTPLMEADPNNIGVWRLLCQAEIESGEVSEAQQALNQLRKLEGQGTEPELSGEINLAMLHLAAAQSDFATAARATPQALGPQIMLARISGLEGDQTMEEARLRDVLRLHPDNAGVIELLGNILRSNGHADEALQLWTNAHQADPNNPLYIHQILMLSLAEKKPAQAAAFLDGTDPFVSGNPVIMGDRVKIDLMTGKLSDARSLLQSMIQQRPNDPTLPVALANFDIGADDINDATKTLDQALVANPHDASLMTARAELTLRNAGLPAALMQAKNWAHDTDHLPQALMIPGELYLAERQPLNASDAFEEAYANSGIQGFLVLEVLTLNGMQKNALSSDQKARLQSRLNGALAKVQDALAKNPLQPGLLDLLAQTDITSGKFAKAQNELTRSISINPTDSVALNNLAYVDDKLNDPEAEELAARAYFLSRTPQISDTFGWILFEKKQYGLALLLLSNAHKALPSDPDIASHYAAALAKAGDQARVSAADGAVGGASAQMQDMTGGSAFAAKSVSVH